MKELTAIAAVMAALAVPVSAQSVTEKITGCATKPIEGSNATQFVDPTCLYREAGDGGASLFDAAVSVLNTVADGKATFGNPGSHKN